MGRFTLRDEGKTIALGKVLKYKPVKVNPYAASVGNQATQQQNSSEASQSTSAKEEGKLESEEQIAQSNTQDQTKAKEELIFDLDSGQMLTREEYNKRNKEREEMDEIGEEDEDEDDEDEEDEGDDDEAAATTNGNS